MSKEDQDFAKRYEIVMHKLPQEVERQFASHQEQINHATKTAIDAHSQGQMHFTIGRFVIVTTGAALFALLCLGFSIYGRIEEQIQSKFEYLDSKIQIYDEFYRQQFFELMKEQRDSAVSIPSTSPQIPPPFRQLQLPANNSKIAPSE